MQDAEGFDAAVLSQLPRVRAIGAGMLPRTADVDDFVHDVIARVYVHRDQLRDQSRMPQWIAAIARNAARTWRRDGAPRLLAQAPTTPTATLADHAEAKERWQAVVDALNALRPEDREVLTAHYLEHQDYDELSERFGQSYTAIGSRLHRARRRMRRSLSALLGGVAALVSSAPRRVYARALAATPTSAAFTVAFAAHVALVAGALLILTSRSESAGGTAAAPVREIVLLAAQAPTDGPIGHAVEPSPDDLSQATVAGGFGAGRVDDGYARLGDGVVLSSNGDAFDMLGEGGLTIEGWFYLAGIPRARERWLLFHKQGSYSAEFWGRDGWYQWPFGSMVDPSFGFGQGGPGEGLSRWAMERDRIPLNRWVHVAIQYDYRLHGPLGMSLLNGTVHTEYRSVWRDMMCIDRRLNGFGVYDSSYTHPNGGPSADPEQIRAAGILLRRTDAPLTIGGLSNDGSQGWKPWGPYTGDFGGRVGEVRISDTARYPFELSDDGIPKRFPVEGRFEPDEHTIALWHFDEGEGSLAYADSSGRGHTLVAHRK
jgi:RNA polymerase sigma factor (sigma-70 family)